MVKTQYVDSDLLKRYIERSGLKKSYLAEQLGISPQAFKQKCIGKIAFRPSEIFTLCHLLNITDDKSKIFVLK